MMANVQMKVNWRRGNADENRYLRFQPNYVSSRHAGYGFATAPAGDPMKANYLHELRLRKNDSTGEMFWTADVSRLERQSQSTISCSLCGS